MSGTLLSWFQSDTEVLIYKVYLTLCMDCGTIVYGLYLETKMNFNVPFTSYFTVIIHCIFLYFTDNLPKRIENINNYFTFSLYSNVCRSLFEKDKLMFAFLLCTRIQAHQGLIMPVSKTQTF